MEQSLKCGVRIQRHTFRQMPRTSDFYFRPAPFQPGSSNPDFVELRLTLELLSAVLGVGRDLRLADQRRALVHCEAIGREAADERSRALELAAAGYQHVACHGTMQGQRGSLD